VVLAKELATLDVLSEGRVEAGLGAGWITAEYTALGETMDRAGVRISRLGEVVEVLKAHWNGEEIDLDLEHFHVHGFSGSPLPLQRPHPPILIGGGGQRILRMAGRLADIVSLNYDNSAGKLGPASVASSGTEATAAKIDWVRKGAGTRFDQIELEVGAYFVDIGEHPTSATEAMARRYGVDEKEFATHPHALIGTVDSVCYALQERRERFGISYVTVMDYALDDFAPVVDRLTGT
jgi:probable F420-dependent oxidoreductase